MLSFFKRAPTPKPGSAFVEGLEHLQVSQFVTIGILKDWGGFADVYVGEYNGRRVALKQLRVAKDLQEKLRGVSLLGPRAQVLS